MARAQRLGIEADVHYEQPAGGLALFLQGLAGIRFAFLAFLIAWVAGQGLARLAQLLLGAAQGLLVGGAVELQDQEGFAGVQVDFATPAS